MYTFACLFRFIFRSLISQKHPGRQIITCLICMAIGGAIIYFALNGIVIGKYSYHFPIYALVGFAIALLGFVVAIEGVVTVFKRGWDGQSGPRRVPATRSKEASTQSYLNEVQGIQVRPGKQERARRAAQEREKARRAAQAAKRERRISQAK